MAKILDGKATALRIREEVAASVEEMQQKHDVTPGLAAVLVGDNPASTIYVRNKERACQEAGMLTQTFHPSGEITQEELLDIIKSLNEDKRFHGILLQLPLPKHLHSQRVLNAIKPEKDVDGLHPLNLGRLAQGNQRFVPATPAGVQQLLLRNGYRPDGKHMVICGRSNIVGKPLAILMMQKQSGANATVTLCHTTTKDLVAISQKADILVVAIGKPRAITADMVRKGAVVVDVGINRIPDSTRPRGYRLEGDVDFGSVSEKAAAISPVPGGVGPMTIAMLLVNTIKAAHIAIHGEA